MLLLLGCSLVTLLQTVLCTFRYRQGILAHANIFPDLLNLVFRLLETQLEVL